MGHSEQQNIAKKLKSNFPAQTSAKIYFQDLYFEWVVNKKKKKTEKSIKSFFSSQKSVV